jgi:Fe-S-cluster-containing hydrogenase component 2
MDLGRLAAPPAEQGTAAPAFAHRCKRVRHRQSECRICVEVCPEGAITLDPGPVVSERCTRCGLCQTACPTEVFQGELHSDQHLLNRIGPMLRREGRPTEGQPLFVHCHEAEPKRRDSVAVPCLGAVTGNFLLGAVALGANPLTLVHGDCGSCRLRSGEALFARAKAACLALAPVVGLKGSALQVEQQQRNDRAFSTRRKFLARVTGQRDHGTSNWPAPGTDAPRPPQGAAEPDVGATPGRTLLQTLLRDASWSPTPSLRYDAGLPWASLKIDQRDCATCGTCVNLCPTGAITRSIENGRLSHHFSSALCINCRLCEEACPQRVISFDPEFDARNLVREEARAITDIRLHACEICGETLPEREDRFCITCHRRGRVENRVPGAAARR